MKFIHAADIHLDSPMLGLERYEGAPVEEARGATRRAFKNLVELAIQEKVDFILIAGDLYDGDWKDYNTGLFFISQMATLREAGIKVVIAAGNHDAASQITRSLRLPENVHRLSVRGPESLIIEEAGAVVHGQGFATRAVTENLAASYPAAVPGLFNIGLLHTSLNGREGHEPYAPCATDDLVAKGYDYWALGHVHSREEVRVEPRIIFPGNTQGRNIRETGEKGCVVVTVEENEISDVEFRELGVFRWSVIDLDVSDASDMDDVIEQAGRIMERVASAPMPSAIRISLKGAIPFHGKMLSHGEYIINGIRGSALNYGGGNLWVEKVLIETTPSIDVETLMTRGDALGGLLRAIHDLRYDDSALKEIGYEIGDIFRKLPHDYLDDPGTIHPERMEPMRRATRDVRHMLLERILSTRDKI